MVPLTPDALAALAEIVRVPGSPWVFAGRTPDRHLSQLTTYWHLVRQKAGVEDVRIHDLRHSFASRALAVGESLAMIGRLLGHNDIGSTARYAHLARDAEKIAVAKVGGSIEADILRPGSGARAGFESGGRVRVRGPGSSPGTGRYQETRHGQRETGPGMAKLRYRSLSRRTVDALSGGGKDVIFWDPELLGFGVRVYPSGAKVYLVQSRGTRGSKRVTVGRHGVISADEARRRAAMIIARIKSGGESGSAPSAPADAGPTVAELAERYLREHVAVHCKPNTARGYRKVIARHLLPLLGRLPIVALGREHVAEMHFRLRKTPSAANEAVAVLSRMLNRAEAWDLLPAGGNPCRFVSRYRTRRPERFLTEEEFRRLGETLDALEAEGRLPAHAAGALKLLMLTGCRSSEITTLRWEEVHLEAHEIRLRDSKTGPRVVPLSPSAVRVLECLPRAAGNPWVIAGRKPGTHLSQLGYYWHRVRRRAGLDDVRIHDLRHSFASRALALGESLSMIGKLLGHSKIQTTARYAHLARDSVKESAARVAADIGADLQAEAPR